MHFCRSRHGANWVALPTHSYGPGQFLVRVRVPLPQVVEQAPHSDHCSNSPKIHIILTVVSKGVNWDSKWFTCWFKWVEPGLKSLSTTRIISRELDIQLVSWWGENTSVVTKVKDGSTLVVSTAKQSNHTSIYISTIINVKLIIGAMQFMFKL